INLLGAIDLQVYNVQGEILTALGDTVLSDNIMTLPALDAALRAEIPMGLAPGGAGRNSLNTIRSLVLEIEDAGAGDHRYMLLERLRRQLSRNSGLFSDDDHGVWERLMGESGTRMGALRSEVEPYTANAARPVPTLAEFDQGMISATGEDLSILLMDPELQAIRDRIFDFHNNPPKTMVETYLALDTLTDLASDAVAGDSDYEDTVVDEISDSTHDAQRAIWGEIPASDLVWKGIPSIIVFDITMDGLPPAQSRADGVSQIRDALGYYEGLRGDGDADEYLALDALKQTLRNTGLESRGWGKDLAKGLGERSDVIVRENSRGGRFPEEISLLSVDVWSRSLGGPIKLTDEYTSLRDSVREYERARPDSPAAEFYRISQLRNKVSELYHAPKVQFLNSDKPAIQKYYNFLDRERTATMDVVPEELHFLWLGKLGQIQVEYIDAWMEKNPEYSVSLWYDEEAVLSYELSRQIKNRAYGIESDPTLPASANQKRISQKVIELQNEAETHIRRGIANGATYDEAAADFMAARLGMDPAALEQVRLNNLESYQEGIAYLEKLHGVGSVELKSVSEVWKANDSFREHYLQELALRGNLAAASDLARIRVLQSKGGIYVDVDLLPKIDEGVFSGWQTKLSSLKTRFAAARLSNIAKDKPISQLTSEVRNRSIEESQRLFQNMVSQMVLETWGKNSMPARNARAHPTDGGTPGYSDYEKIILDAVRHDARVVAKLEEFKAHLKQIPRDRLYASLGEFRVAPGTIYAGITQREIVGNGFLAAAGDNSYLQEWERIINLNYRLLEETGADSVTSSEPAELTGV
ncbi:MAG: hypothetical protein MI747_00635, partial [Desulfobacterales bacterium]|nr:hypothetical protein [Desulfobacterales bacterium]